MTFKIYSVIYWT